MAHGLLALQHVGSKFPDQGSNLSALNGRRYPLDHQAGPAPPVLSDGESWGGTVSPPALFFCFSVVLAVLGLSPPVLVNIRFGLLILVK